MFWLQKVSATQPSFLLQHHNAPKLNLFSDNIPLSREEASQFTTAVIALAEPVTIHCLRRPRLRDPNDEMVLEVAVNGQASAIITFNQEGLLSCG